MVYHQVSKYVHRLRSPAAYLLTYLSLCFLTTITRVMFPIVSTFLSKKLKSRIGLIPEVDGRVDKLFEYLPPTAVPVEVGGTAAFDMEAWAASTLK